MREDLAPLGYAKASDIKFTIKNTGDVQKVQMKDEETVVNVSKLTKDGKYLSGATGDCIRMARDAILQKCMEYIIKNKELPVFNIKDIDSIEHSKNEIVTLVDVDYNEVKKKCDTLIKILALTICFVL